MFFVKFFLLILIVYFGLKFIESIANFISDVVDWWDWKQNHCSICDEELKNYGYPDDEKRGCPNNCIRKKFEKDNPDLFK